MPLPFHLWSVGMCGHVKARQRAACRLTEPTVCTSEPEEVTSSTVPCVWMIKCCEWDLTGDCFSSISQTNWFCTSHKSTDVQHHRGRPQRRDGSFCCFAQSHRGGCCGCLHAPHPLREVCASSSPHSSGWSGSARSARRGGRDVTMATALHN